MKFLDAVQVYFCCIPALQTGCFFGSSSSKHIRWKDVVIFCKHKRQLKPAGWASVYCQVTTVTSDACACLFRFCSFKGVVSLSVLDINSSSCHSCNYFQSQNIHTLLPRCDDVLAFVTQMPGVKRQITLSKLWYTGLSRDCPQ